MLLLHGLEQRRQVAHVGENDGAPALQSGSGGNSTRVCQHAHASRQRSCHATQAVLDDDTLTRIGMHPCAACSKRSGAGFPRGTSVALKIRPAKRSYNPTSVSENLIFSCVPLDATHVS